MVSDAPVKFARTLAAATSQRHQLIVGTKIPSVTGRPIHGGNFRHGNDPGVWSDGAEPTHKDTPNNAKTFGFTFGSGEAI